MARLETGMAGAFLQTSGGAVLRRTKRRRMTPVAKNARLRGPRSPSLKLIVFSMQSIVVNLNILIDFN